MTEVSAAAPQARVFVIDRSTWLRGEGSQASRLLRPTDGKMCCLGSIALQCGATADDIEQVTSPARLRAKLGRPLPGFSESLLDGPSAHHNSPVCEELMSTNDDQYITDAAREAELQRHAAALGWTLDFVDQLPEEAR